jgi:predicted DCC family thiol-disulfide oxidoreductase YuxK
MKVNMNAANGNNVVYPLTVYYDHSCSMCRSEIENIAARDTRNELVMIDCSHAQFDATALPYGQQEMMDCITAQDAAGAWHRGVDVFIAMYDAVDMGWVARALVHPRVKPLAIRGYPWIVRNRHFLSTLGLHHVMNVFAARTKQKRAEADARAAAAFAKSQGCATTTCATEPTKE